MTIYGLSLVMLFTTSSLHHGLDSSPRVNEALRTLDYDSVFFLIAGTVTPLVLVLVRNTYGWTVFGAVWAIAISGIVLRSVWRRVPKYITNTLYISLGWLTVALIGGGVSLPWGALALMAAGGLVYSMGFVIFGQLCSRRFSWQLFVFAAAVLTTGVGMLYEAIGVV